MLAPYLEKYLEAAETVDRHDRLPQGLGGARVRLPQAARLGRRRWSRLDEWLADNAAPKGAQRYVGEARAEVARALAAQEHDAADRALVPSRADRALRADTGSLAVDGRKCPVAVQARKCPVGSGVEGVLRARVLGEHRDAALEAAEQVAGGELRRHREHGQLDLGVGEVRRTSPPVTTSVTRRRGSTRISTLRGGATSRLCSRVAHARVSSPSARSDEDGELEAAGLLGEADRPVEGEPVGARSAAHQLPLAPPARESSPSGAGSSATPWRGPPNHWPSGSFWPVWSGSSFSPRTIAGR